MKYVILCVALLMGGCASLPEAQVNIPASLMQKCPPLQKLEGETGEHLLRNIVENASLYHECAASKDKLIEALRPVK